MVACDLSFDFSTLVGGPAWVGALSFARDAAIPVLLFLVSRRHARAAWTLATVLVLSVIGALVVPSPYGRIEGVAAAAGLVLLGLPDSRRWFA